MGLWLRFWRDERGATSIEYCAIATFVSILCVAGVTTMGSKLNAKFIAPIAGNL